MLHGSTAIDQIHNATRKENSCDHGGDDAYAQCDGETLDRTAAQRKQYDGNN